MKETRLDGFTDRGEQKGIVVDEDGEIKARPVIISATLGKCQCKDAKYRHGRREATDGSGYLLDKAEGVPWCKHLTDEENRSLKAAGVKLLLPPDSSPSKDALIEVDSSGNAEKARRGIVMAIQANGACNSHELSGILKIDLQTLSPRFKELRRTRVIKIVGHKLNPAGKVKVRVYDVTELDEAYLAGDVPLKKSIPKKDCITSLMAAGHDVLEAMTEEAMQNAKTAMRVAMETYEREWGEEEEEVENNGT